MSWLALGTWARSLLIAGASSLCCEPGLSARIQDDQARPDKWLTSVCVARHPAISLALASPEHALYPAIRMPLGKVTYFRNDAVYIFRTIQRVVALFLPEFDGQPVSALAARRFREKSTFTG